MIQRAYKYRFYPTKAQEKALAQHFGCARFVWNHCLALRSDLYKHRCESINYVGLSKHLTHLKRCGDYDWLNDAPAVLLTQSLIDQDKAFQNFFKGRAKYPKFKKRTHKQSVRVTLDQRQIHNNYRAGELLKLPKLGAVKIRWSRVPKGIPKMATITRNPDGRYYVSFTCEEPKPQAKTKQSAVGIDAGIKDVLVTSDGYHSGAPKYTYRYARRLKLEQRKLSRKKKGSNRWHKQRQVVAKIHAKIAACRLDFLHKETSALVHEHGLISIEDLNVSGMLKNRRLSKAVADVGMFELRRQLQYKASWHGSQVVAIDRWFPSTKMCSGCGQLHAMPLAKREMVCDCGVSLDRDENAARNILAEGIRSLHVEGDTSLPPDVSVGKHPVKRGPLPLSGALHDVAT